MSRKKHIVSNLQLREISSVDRPAQVGAVSVLMKRGEPREVELLKVTFDEALKGNLLADRVRDAFYKAFENLWEGKEAFRKALVDELAAGGDGSTASEAFKTWLGTLVDAAMGAAKALGAADTAALEDTITKAANDWLEAQETDMVIKDRAALKTAIEKAQAAGDKLTVGEVTAIHKAATELKAEDELPATGPLAKADTVKVDDTLAHRLERMEKRDALSADLRKHYDSLTDDAARDAFLAKSADDQKAEITKAQGDDPVVYTTLDGTDIRKSAGDTVLALAKRNDQLARDLAKSQATSEDVELTKRAGEVLGNVGGDLIGKKALLKAVDSITDAATKDAAMAVLKAADAAGKGVFKERGTSGENLGKSGSDGSDKSDTEAKLEDMAKAHAKENNVSFEKAYAAVIQTAEGAELYKRYVTGE